MQGQILCEAHEMTLKGLTRILNRCCMELFAIHLAGKSDCYCCLRHVSLISSGAEVGSCAPAASV